VVLLDERVIKDAARRLRREQTPSEDLLWECLRDRRLGHKFRRQQVIGRFVADFLCKEKRLVIELDGGVHLTQRERDAERDRYLKEYGYEVVRFRNEEVTGDINAVLDTIAEKLDGSPSSFKYRPPT
jgi:very-short-patch-repair endonuclease